MDLVEKSKLHSKQYDKSFKLQEDRWGLLKMVSVTKLYHKNLNNTKISLAFAGKLDFFNQILKVFDFSAVEREKSPF